MTYATATASPVAPATVTVTHCSASATIAAPATAVAQGVPRIREAVTEQTTAYGSMTLRIRTFGQFSVSFLTPDGPRTPRWANEQTRVLLKCLLAAPAYRLTREQVIESLWPHQPSRQGRDALRHALSRLRRTLEPGRSAYGDSSVLGSSREEVWLIVESGEEVASSVWVDRVHFERDALDALDYFKHDRVGNGAIAERLGERARALYIGPFLPAEIYSDWAQETRARCERLWVALTRALVDHASAQRRFEQALLLLAELFAALPADEDAASRLMRMQAAMGHRAEALRTYERICAQLDSHLGVQPTRELKALSQIIRSCESQQELLRLVLAEPSAPQPLPLEPMASLTLESLT